MIENELQAGILYQGNPSDVLMAMAQRIVKALEQAGIAPTGIHILALLYAVSSVLHNGRQDYVKGDTSLGVMPSFKTVLTLLTRVSMGARLSQEETQEFNDDFVAIIKSLGGSIEYQSNTLSTTSLSNSHVIIAPLSKEVH